MAGQQETAGTRPAAAAASAHVGIGTALVLAVGGGVLGAFGGFLQAWTVPFGDTSLPVGLMLVLACLVACIRALVHAFGTRKAGILFFLGWVVVSVILALPTSEGDIVITRDATAMVYLFGGVVLGSACANVPARLRPAVTTPPGSGGAP